MFNSKLVKEIQTVSVVGIGRLGLGFALYLEKCGFEVIGVDKNQSHVDLVNSKKLKSYEPFVNDYLSSAKNFHATTDLKKAFESQVIFILVATPSLPSGSYDHSQVESVIEQLVQFGRQEEIKHIVISCTVSPGFCDKTAAHLEPLNYVISYNPEFLAQGSVIKNLQNPDMVVIGEKSKKFGDQVEEIYREICTNNPVFQRMSPWSAEITKIALNCFMSTKISFANSIGDLAHKAGAETEKILNALGSDSRIGHKYLGYGFGYGGPCLPRDNTALGNFAQHHGIDLPLSKATDETNRKHLDFQFEQYVKKYDKSQTITFDGVSYKKGTDIIDESQQLALAVKLANEGYKVLVLDNQSVIDKVKNLYDSLFEFEVV